MPGSDDASAVGFVVNHGSTAPRSSRDRVVSSSVRRGCILLFRRVLGRQVMLASRRSGHDCRHSVGSCR